MALIDDLLAQQNYFASGATKPYAFRLKQLKRLKTAIEQHENELYSALFSDLKKSKEECWVTENGMVLAELRTAIKELKTWMTPESTSTNLLNMPSNSKVYKEPLGVVLIISPWNYPFQLLFNPLIAAIAAGNCIVLKASEFTPATSALMRKIIELTFVKEYILFVEGDGGAVVPEMMNSFTFDHVFYTGSTTVGRLIYKMAADKLVPVTLELGGKSPCIVEADAHLKVAAKRIAIAKFSNCGQMCVAPDYVLVHASIKEKFITILKETILKFFSADATTNYNYGRIVNQRQFDRLQAHLKAGNIIFGGESNAADLFIAPTLVDSPTHDSILMQEEIFGPILPILSFETEQEVMKIISANKNPLSLYVFTSSAKKEQFYIQNIAFGGGCINNASWHLTNHSLPFGGRGFSGTGNYHGIYGFNTFSHKKAIMSTPTWFDPSIKYPPFKGKLSIFKKLIR